VSNPSKRILELDGLRGIAVLAVFGFHAFGIRLGWMGVDLFFVLSGFLITGILVDLPKRSFSSYLGDFYARRVRRILPPVILLLVVVSLIHGFAWARHWYLYFGLMNLLYLTGAQNHHLLDVIGMWSLAVEEQFYFFWPLLVFRFSPKRLSRTALGLILLAPLLRAVCTPLVAGIGPPSGHWVIYSMTPFRMDCLAAGALISLLWRRFPQKIHRFGPAAGMFSICLLGVFNFVLARHPSFGVFVNSLQGNVLTLEIGVLSASGLMLWALSRQGTVVLRLWPLRWMARISFSFYLIHPMVLDIVRNRMASLQWHRLTAVAVVTFVISALYSEVSWWLLERPILHSSRKPSAGGGGPEELNYGPTQVAVAVQADI
jgi:peptidoglycan/LPS O-acetylase OafA/YrhL